MMKAKFLSAGLVQRSIVAGMVIFLGVSASAATINEPFSSPLGGLPSGFARADNGSNSTSKIVTMGTTNYLQLGVDDNVNQNAAVYYTAGDNTATTNNQFSDFGGSVDVHFEDVSGISDYFSIVLRAQNPDFNNSGGYYISLRPKAGSPGTGHLTIYEVSTTGTKTIKAQSLAGSNVGGGIYPLSFSLIGNALSATWYDSNGIDVRATVTTNLATAFSSGYIGLRSDSAKDSKYVYFRNLEVHSVPEPAAMSLVLLAGGMTLVRRRRR